MEGSVASYSQVIESAVGAGATPDDCTDVLEGIIDIVGVPRAVVAAPKLAMALGCDIEDDL
jgi:hypothetical protein